MASTDDPATARPQAKGKQPASAPDTLPDSRPNSLRAAGASALFEANRFDPLHAQKAAEHYHLASQFDVCRPALALRVLMFVQISVALVALPLAQGLLDAAVRAALLAFAALTGGLLWLPAVCALRPWLSRRSRWARAASLAGLGAASAAGAWAALAGLNLAPMQAGWGSAACGAALALGLWHWLGLRAAAAQPVEATARLAELQ